MTGGNQQATRKAPHACVGYAVVDTETTGIMPGRHHRIAEIAVVQLDLHGRVVDEWCTLVNPKRDLGRQQIHGIRAADVRRAPTFDRIAGHVLDLLSARVVVAHNLPFDAMHLRAEFNRMGTSLPLSLDTGLCTMRLAAEYLHGVGRSLHDCCSATGITLNDWHSALADARATASLFGHYLSAAGTPPPWQSQLSRAGVRDWPSMPADVFDAVLRSRVDNPEPHFLARIVDRLPRVDNPDADSYLSLLDRALIDRHISAHEADELVEAAYSLGLHKADLVGLHKRYLGALAQAAWQDGIVTNDEREDLRKVAGLLGMSIEDADQAIDQALVRPDGGITPTRPAGWAHSRIQPGDLVVFTGEMSQPRDVWKERCRTVGLNPHGSVTKKVALVVAADPDSLSGKARKARDYGIPVVTEEAFARLLEDFAGR